ncbi:vesicular glutamate transporter 3-like [Tropilaelaps mercedesae]|uniref:Vesicular glutamate transporter 3-like n=1 Tax=Tropilaelaps mercedesae TaxID=418985 RepID=A0A1V9XKG7_9ACAR|nr:vesicular glutamate transporter 3-like [Tropilaelaps mercedesae]
MGRHEECELKNGLAHGPERQDRETRRMNAFNVSPPATSWIQLRNLPTAFSLQHRLVAMGKRGCSILPFYLLWRRAGEKTSTSVRQVEESGREGDGRGGAWGDFREKRTEGRQKSSSSGGGGGGRNCYKIQLKLIRFRGDGAAAKYGQLDDDEGGGVPAGHGVGAPGGGVPVHSVDHVEIDHGPQDWRKYMEPNCPCAPDMSKRMTVAVLSSIGFLISFGIRCNWGVAIVQMTSNTSDSGPEFDWEESTIGLIDSSFFWGYLVTQVPGGFLAAKYPANRVFGTAIACSAALNILIPAATGVGVGVIMLVRVLQGLIETGRKRAWDDMRLNIRGVIIRCSQVHLAAQSSSSSSVNAPSVNG